MILIKKDRDLGIKACTKSVLSLLKHAKETNLKHITIFEDDVVPHKNFNEYWEKVKKFIKDNNNWKMIFLGVSRDLNINDTEFTINNFPSVPGGKGIHLMISLPCLPINTI